MPAQARTLWPAPWILAVALSGWGAAWASVAAPVDRPPGSRPSRPAASGHSPPSRGELAALWARTVTLATLEQASTQSEQDFLRQTAESIDAFTASLKAEVCGVFERDDATTRLMITVLTQGSPAFCLTPRTRVAAGGGLAGLSIHSHVTAPPTGGSAGGPEGVDGPVRYLGARFSMSDIAAGPGYLVHRGRLWHQRGLGTQRFVARLDAPPPDARPVRLLATHVEPAPTGGSLRSDWRDDGWAVTGGDS